MSKVRVYKLPCGWDWIAECSEHGELTWTEDWEMAMEMTWGHLMMNSHREESRE